jgi:hypothetical protein
MGRRRKVVLGKPTKPPVEFSREYEAVLPNGKTIVAGEIIKIMGEYGTTFRFDSLTTNVETGVSWIECRELYKGQIAAFRAFYIERVKKLPVRRKKRVK